MKTDRSVLAALVLAVCLAGCHGANEVRLFRDRNMRETVWVQKLDPDRYKAREKELQITLDVAIGQGKLAHLTREASIARRLTAAWDANLQALNARYALVCNDVNSGNITYEEYMQWQKRLDDMCQRIADAKKEMVPIIRAMTEAAAELAQKELDAETAKKRGETIEQGRSQMVDKIDTLLKDSQSLVVGL